MNVNAESQKTKHSKIQGRCHQLQCHSSDKSRGPYRPNAVEPYRPENSTGYGAKLNPWWIGSCPPSNPSGDWVLSPRARHYPMGGVGHSSATMSIFLETKAPHEDTLLDLCMVHMTCSSLQQLNIRYWSYICTCVSDIQKQSEGMSALLVKTFMAVSLSISSASARESKH